VCFSVHNVVPECDKGGPTLLLKAMKMTVIVLEYDRYDRLCS